MRQRQRRPDRRDIVWLQERPVSWSQQHAMQPAPENLRQDAGVPTDTMEPVHLATCGPEDKASR